MGQPFQSFAASTRRRSFLRARTFFSALLILLLLVPANSHAYSVLSHEEVVDLMWQSRVVPLLLSRFPQTTPEMLVEAHSYAYGGCIIQDLGYYPFGSKFFSDLLHYVRTGDFVRSLLDDATDVNEYAFALGALAHYASDAVGHPGINRATAEEYPKLRTRFGKVVTYADDPTAHLRTEFGFDVVQVARGRYAQDDYRNFIGFRVSKGLLERAFRDTYGFEVNQVLPHEDLAINTYRSSVSSIIPKMTRVALVDFGNKLEQERPDFDRKKFVYRFSRTEYEKQWGKEYKRPGTGSRIFAFFVRIFPKVGPFRALDLQVPSPQAQDTYIKSINDTVDTYRALMDQISRQPLHNPAVRITNFDLDTGELVAPGEYSLADKTYARLVAELVKHPETPIPVALRNDVLDYYANPAAKNTMQKNRKDWARVETDVAALQRATPSVVKVSDQPTKQQEAPVRVQQ